MKIASRVLVTLIAVMLVAGCGQKAESAKNVAPTVVVGLDDHFPPMGFRDEKNEIVGFDIDLAREAARRMGVNVTFKPIEWAAKEAELNGKRIDMLWNGLTITEPRKVNILFSKPYLANHQIIVVPEASAIRTRADLAGKTVGVQDGSSAVDAIHKNYDISKTFKELRRFPDNVTALMDLATGRLDAIVIDEIVGRYTLGKRPGEFRVLDEDFGEEEYGVGFGKDNTELMTKVQQALDSMIADGTAAAISKRWFGKDIIKK